MNSLFLLGLILLGVGIMMFFARLAPYNIPFIIIGACIVAYLGVNLELKIRKEKEDGEKNKPDRTVRDENDF